MTKATTRTIALVAHDNCKSSLAIWAGKHAQILQGHHLICTGTTGKIITKTLHSALGEAFQTSQIQSLKSGPLGGDVQLGAMIAEGRVDILVFFWDPMQAQPHDVDVKALLRISNLYNVPTACNAETANYLISSPLFLTEHTKEEYDFASYTSRSLQS